MVAVIVAVLLIIVKTAVTVMGMGVGMGMEMGMEMVMEIGTGRLLDLIFDFKTCLKSKVLGVRLISWLVRFLSFVLFRYMFFIFNGLYSGYILRVYSWWWVCR